MVKRAGSGSVATQAAQSGQAENRPLAHSKSQRPFRKPMGPQLPKPSPKSLCANRPKRGWDAQSGTLRAGLISNLVTNAQLVGLSLRLTHASIGYLIPGER